MTARFRFIIWDRKMGVHWCTSWLFSKFVFCFLRLSQIFKKSQNRHFFIDTRHFWLFINNFNIRFIRSTQKSVIFNENVDAGYAWKLVQFLYQLLAEKNLNFERVKLTLNGQISGFIGHNQVHWDVFYRCQTILSPTMIIDKLDFMDELWYLPQCGRFGI